MSTHHAQPPLDSHHRTHSRAKLIVALGLSAVAVLLLFFQFRPAQSERRLRDESAGSVAATVADSKPAAPQETNLEQMLSEAGITLNELELYEQICAEYPDLESDGLSDFEYTTLLRQWAWSHTDCVLSPKSSFLINHDPRTAWGKLDTAAIFDLFDQNHGGVLCGGTSHALKRLYEMFGFRAWTVSSGADDLTHEITVVEIDTPTGRQLCVQDAYFNVTIVDTMSGEPLDYFDMLTRLADSRHDSIQAVESDYRSISAWPSTIVSQQELGDFNAAWVARDSFTVLESDYIAESLPGGSVKITSPRTYSKFLEDRFHRAPDGEPAWYMKWIADQGHPPNMLYLYLYPLNVGGPEQGEFLERAQEIVESTPSRTRPVQPDQRRSLLEQSEAVNSI